MALVFISYSSKHRDLAKVLITAIEAQYGPGSVWWDQALESRAAFEPQIKAALERARVVVVIWSTGATASDFVYSEASYALHAGKLVNVRPPDVPANEIPMPFDIYHIDDLANTDRILSAIALVMRGSPVPTRVPLAEMYRRQHGKRVLEEKQFSLPADPSMIGPSELLQAKYALVDYDDTTGMCRRVMAWCLSAGATAGRLVHGAGGFGKTRLMIESAVRLRQDHGWQAGFLDRPPEDEAVARQRWQALDQLIVHGKDRGLLIVMDYAEARQKELCNLAERLGQRAADDPRPIRLVLLTRSAGEWWTSLLNESEELRGLFRDRPGERAAILMPTLTPGEERLRYFAASVRALEPVMRAQGYAPDTQEPSPTRLHRMATGDSYARPLAIQMEAMLWLAASAPEDGEQGVHALLARVLGLERTHWTKLLGTLDHDRKRDLRRGVAQVTTVQGVDTISAAEQLLMADGFFDDRTARAKVDGVVQSLAIVYGLPDGGIAPLAPDLIGEHHVGAIADVDLIDGCLAWIEREAEGLRMKRRQDVLTVLQRATQDEHGEVTAARASALLDHIIRNHGDYMGAAIVAVMADTPGALFSRLTAQVETLTEPALAAINFALPVEQVSWMEFSLRVAERYAAVARRRTLAAQLAQLSPDEQHVLLDRRASAIGILGLRLSRLGRHQEALAALQEAADLHRALARDRPDAFLKHLAASLNNLGTGFSQLGRREKALTVSQEAVDVYRTLAKDRSDTFLPALAGSLTNLGGGLSDLGRPEEACAASQEAVDIYRLARDRPDAFRLDLARSLNNLGRDLSHLGRRESARTAFQEAVDLYRPLAQDRPDAFRPDLARSLSNLSGGLSSLGRHEEARASSQEAVDIYRPLAQDRPDAFRPDLARSLNNLNSALYQLGRREEALAASQEAVDLYRALAQDRPEAFLTHFARGLSDLGLRLSLLGRQDEALAPFKEAVDLHRALAQDRPDVFRSELAASLRNLGRGLSQVGRHEEARTASQEAVDIYRPLAQKRPDAFLPKLAQSLGELSRTLFRAERYVEAAETAREGAAATIHLAETQPQAFVELSRALCRDHLEACEKAGCEPDRALLSRLAKTLDGGE